jgi:hypothetical protein
VEEKIQGGEIVAEFQEVMRQWRRFCQSHNNCGECEFDGKGICGEAHLSDIPYANIELRIMAWAKEHPAPVYPTYWEWLASIGAVTRKVKPDVASNLIETGLLDPIPDDIAEKLGIEPKEG